MCGTRTASFFIGSISQGNIMFRCIQLSGRSVGVYLALMLIIAAPTIRAQETVLLTKVNTAGLPAYPQPDNRASKVSNGLGLQIDVGTGGVLGVATVDADGIAARGGLKPGDQISTVDGRVFTSPRLLTAYLSGQFGRRVPVRFVRGAQEHTAFVAIPRPAGDTAWLGLVLEENEGSRTGAVVAEVYPGGPADHAGITAGDVFIEANNLEVVNPADLIDVIDGLKPDSGVQMKVLRGEREIVRSAILARRDRFISPQNTEDLASPQETAGAESPLLPSRGNAATGSVPQRSMHYGWR
jgi:S1-C subfamily serine protease